jgi:serine/threonine-protein phosphatase 2A regulatory subunit A
MEGLFPVGLLEVKAMNSLTVSSDTSLVDMFRELKITKQSFFTTPKFTTLINDVLPVIAELSRDRAWRVRLSVITKSTMLLSLLGLKTWEKYFKNVLIGALSDHVFTVRECACTQVGSIVAAAGAEWAAEKFFPTAFSIYDKGNNYLHRMTCLRMIMKLNSEEKVESSTVQTKLYPIVSQAVDDDVANVKINAAKCLALMVPRVNAALLKKIKPQLRKLSQDEDDDVAYFAQQALDDHAQYFKK